MQVSRMTDLGGSAPTAQLSMAIRRVALAASGVAIAVGAIVLIGWWSGLGGLTTLLPGLPPMKTNTAVLMVAGGVALALTSGQRARPIAILVAAFIVAVAGLTLAEYATGLSLGIDRLLASSPGPLPGAPYPGRISLQTALALLAAGLALLVLGRAWHGIVASELLGLGCAGVGMMCLLGYVFDAETLTTLGSGTRSSLGAAIGLFALGTGIVTTEPRHHLVRYFSDPGLAGQLARRMLPAVLLAVPLAGAIDAATVRAGLVDERLGAVLTLTVEVVLLVAIGAWLTGRTLRLEARRVADEAAARAREVEAQRRLNRELQAISTCHQVLMRAADEASLLHDICRIVCDAAGYRMAWVGYPEQDAAQTIRPVAWAGLDGGYLEGARFSWGDTDRGRGAVGAAIRSERTVYVQDFATDPRMVPWRDMALARGFRSTIALPLAGETGSPFGVLAIYAAEPNAFTPEEIRLLEELASDLAFGIGILRSRAIQERLEAQLRQAQKMEVVGQLAGGIAHDFNNLLTAIRGYAELMRTELPPGDTTTLDADLGEILSAANQAELLTRHLLAFARRQVLVPLVLSPAEVVARLAPMLRRVLGEHVELVVQGEPSGQVRVDPGQLEQVVLNLAINARDAMPDGGRLTIETEDADLDETAAAAHPGTSPGRYVSLTVTDSGVGMDQDTQSHLFEPFFTTKPEGQGTGLGLATVYGIVRQSGGAVSIRSEPGHGTQVRIDLPRMAVPDDTCGGPVESPALIPAGAETILLVEDDPAIRAYAARVLASLGYTVLQAGSGADALGLASADARRIDLLMTDIVMPGMQGTELARRLSAVRPGVRVLLMSGYDRGALGQAELDRSLTFLAKPFTREALGRAVRSALDAPVTATAG